MPSHNRDRRLLPLAFGPCRPPSERRVEIVLQSIGGDALIRHSFAHRQKERHGDLAINHHRNERLTVHSHFGTDPLNAEQFKNSVAVLTLVQACILDRCQVAWCKAMTGNNITQFHNSDTASPDDTRSPMLCRIRGEISRIERSRVSA